MSYIAHDFDVQGANRADAGSLTAANLFGKLEMAVIALARSEPASSAGQPGRVRRLFGRLFSLPPANGLANERLETLRRAGDHGPPPRRSGCAPAAAGPVPLRLHSPARRGAARPGGAAVTARILLVLAAIIVASLLLGSYLDDPVLGLVLGLIMPLPLVALTGQSRQVRPAWS
jgi:hypothetical protein